MNAYKHLTKTTSISCAFGLLTTTCWPSVSKYQRIAVSVRTLIWCMARYSWDYVMVFEVRAEDKELTSYQRKFSMKEILTRLNAGGERTLDRVTV